MARRILYVSPDPTALDRLRAELPVPDADWQTVQPVHFADVCPTLRQYELLLLAETVDAPIRLAQQAFAQDKYLSVLLLAGAANLPKLKQAIQFSPFIGPTVQGVAADIGVRLAPIVVDALQRTAQRRSFARVQRTALATPQFEPQVLAKVRADFSTKVLETAPIGAVLLTASGAVASANQYALSLLGKPEQDVLNALLPDLFPVAVRPDIQQFVFDGYLSAPKRVVEVPWPTGPQHLELSVASISAPSAASYKLLILNDITGIVVAQRQTQTDLRDLTRLNTDLDNFIYAASHDLKQPIANIEGLLTVVREELAAPTGHVEIPPLLDMMQQAVERFQRTIEQLTDISRLQQAGSQPAEPVELAAVVEDVRLDLLPQLHAAGGQLLVAVPAGTALVFSPKNLRSIVYNLLSNAVKYRDPARALRVQVRGYPAGNFLVLEVQDNGLGLDTTKLQKVFGLFQRQHDHVAGSGVGLYMVKQLIDNAGGHIEVESQEGTGATFRVYFPSSQA